jgi:hypothetical protein
MIGTGQMPAVAELLSSQLAAFLALLLAASAIHKSLRFGRARSVMHEFAGVPRAAAPLAVAAACLGEGLSAVLLIVPASRSIGAWLAAAILGAYLGLIVHAIAKDRRHVDCGCSFGATRRALGTYEVVRNCVLVAFALLVAASADGRAAPLAASQMLAACAFLALYGALDQVMGLRPMRRGAVL